MNRTKIFELGKQPSPREATPPRGGGGGGGGCPPGGPRSKPLTFQTIFELKRHPLHKTLKANGTLAHI